MTYQTTSAPFIWTARPFLLCPKSPTSSYALIHHHALASTHTHPHVYIFHHLCPKVSHLLASVTSIVHTPLSCTPPQCPRPQTLPTHPVVPPPPHTHTQTHPTWTLWYFLFYIPLPHAYKSKDKHSTQTLQLHTGSEEPPTWCQI